MSNTIQRILSAIVLVAIVCAAFLGGIPYLQLLILVISILCYYEFSNNFLKLKQTSTLNIINYALLVCAQVYLVRSGLNESLFIPIVGVILSLILMIYLFFTKIESVGFVSIFKKLPVLVVVCFTIVFANLEGLLTQYHWKEYIIVLLIFNFSMDTGAWFFGKNFGRNKLWPSVSPNKTLEGLIGGALTSSVFGTTAWYYLLEDFDYLYIVIFFVFGLLSQVGDLVQSKLKRQIGVKDSSRLIPGHGGVYDRIDSLLFVTPFYGLLIYLDIL